MPEWVRPESETAARDALCAAEGRQDYVVSRWVTRWERADG